MSKSNETPSTPANDDANVLATGASAASSNDLEEVVQQFWEKNRNLLLALAAVILVAIIGRNGWAAFKAGQIESIREEYAVAESASEKQAFADDRAGTALAGVALLDIADEAFAAGRYEAAISAYDAAAAELSETPLADRIPLGKAMAQLLGGQMEAGKLGLQSVANDTSAAVAVRGEAIYHLSALAVENRDLAEIEALATQVNAVTPGSTWAQRVTMMQAAAEAAAPAGEMESSEISVELP
jgi:predicted negative regulator of RcsB-dependent stress response